MTDEAKIVATVNGLRREAVVPVRLNLADFLRDYLRLTGTHVGCEHGVCGACTVIVEGAAVRSCLMFAVQVDGQSVETVEGLGRVREGDAEPELTRLQEAMRRNHAVQCGFCTPGFLMTATAAMRESAIADEARAREVLSGNVCRCTGYAGLVRALVEAGSASA